MLIGSNIDESKPGPSCMSEAQRGQLIHSFFWLTVHQQSEFQRAFGDVIPATRPTYDAGDGHGDPPLAV